MSWINEIDESSGHKLDNKTNRNVKSDEILREALVKIKQARGKVGNIMKAQSLNPRALIHHLELYTTLMFGESQLSRAEREMIALVVSAANNCAYCTSHVADALSHYEKDNERLREIIAGRQYLGLPDRQAKMLRYASKLTRQPDKMNAQDIASLREAGLNDTEILDVNLLSAYFNFANRIACGLGVEFDEEEITGYKV